MTEPHTRNEWQVAVDAAHAGLCLDAARAYGLITGGPEVNVARCEEILEKGKRKGISPRPDAIERLVAGLVDRERPRGQVGQPHMPSPYGGD